MNLFHVTKKQPSGGLEIKTATGDIASFTTHYSEPLPPPFNSLNIKCSIVATGGGGTPATPIPIVGHSELNLVRCGKNLWDEQYEVGQYNPSNGQPMSASNAIRNKDYIIIPSDTSFALLFPSGISGRIFFFDSNKTMVSTEGIGSGITVKTMPSGCCFLRFHTSTSYGETYHNDIAILYPSTETQYVSFNGQTFTVQFGQTVYGGVYDANRGKVRITWAIDIIKNHFITGNIEDNGFRTNNYLSNTPKAAYGNCICNIFKRASSYAQAVGITSGSENSIGFNAAGQILLNAYQNGAFVTTWGELDALIPAEGVQIAYELATPIEIDVLELSVDTIVGVNNVFADTGSVEVKYLDVV